MEWETAAPDANGTLRYPRSWALPHYYEALSILFRVENALRMFTYIILKANFKDQWIGLHVGLEGTDKKAISAIAKQRYQQDKTFGYLGFPSQCPMLHLTTGELLDLITGDNQWPKFRDYIPTTKDMFKTKFIEFGNVRNAFAHFRPLKESDMTTVKQNALQMLPQIEACLSDFLDCYDTVPTNTTDQWYDKLRGIGTPRCPVYLNQSSDEKWVRLTLDYQPEEVRPRNSFAPTSFSSTVHKIVTPSILSRFPDIQKLCVCLSEEAMGWFDGNALTLRQQIRVMFYRETLEQDYTKITEALIELMKQLNKESELIKDDHLARGSLVQSGFIYANQQPPSEGQAEGAWRVYADGLNTPLSDDDPPEYWGQFRKTSYSNFVSHAATFPWMQSDFSWRQY